MTSGGSRRTAAVEGEGPYHPGTERHRRRARGRLGLRDASAMAVGGMIGGGIFWVLGVTIQLAGHLAVVFVQLAVDQPASLALIAGLLLGVGGLRLVFVRWAPVVRGPS